MNKDFQPPPVGLAPPPPYQQPQSSYYPGQQPQPSNIVVVQNPSYGPTTQRVTCPYCGADILTRVEREANMKTHMSAFCLCVFLLWCLAPIPYCMDSCLVKKHYCPNCKNYLGMSDN